MALPWTNKILGLETQVASLTALIEGTGLFTLARADDGTLSLARTQKAADLFALGDVSGELAEANTNLSALTDSNLALERENGAYKAAFPAGGHFAFADGKVALTEAGKTALINAGITAHLAASGHGALPIGAAVDTGTVTKPDESKMTLEEKLQAARVRSIASINAQPAVAAYIQENNLRK